VTSERVDTHSVHLNLRQHEPPRSVQAEVKTTDPREQRDGAPRHPRRGFSTALGGANCGRHFLLVVLSTPNGCHQR
jgi:hypothetical protein